MTHILSGNSFTLVSNEIHPFLISYN